MTKNFLGNIIFHYIDTCTYYLKVYHGMLIIVHFNHNNRYVSVMQQHILKKNEEKVYVVIIVGTYEAIIKINIIIIRVEKIFSKSKPCMSQF